MSIYLATIRHDSYSPDATLLVKTIDAIPPDSKLPSLKSSPQGGSDVEQAQNDQQTQEDNCATLSAYYATLAKNHATIPGIQKQVKEQVTDPIRNLDLPATDNIATDLPGALERSSEWFQGETGEKWFFAITDLINNTDQQRSGTVDFKDVAVRIDWHYCGNDTDESAMFCMQNDNWWIAYFQQAGASLMKLLDPAQSEALGSNLFS